jgi:hypothetical protein
MVITGDRLAELGRALDAARNDPARRCGVALTGPDGKDHWLAPKPGADVARLRRKLGQPGVLVDNGVPHVVIPHGTCSPMNLGIDPETGEVACTLHGKGGR